MIELALRYDQGFVMLKDIAQCQDISERYLEQILPLFRTAGLIVSKRGSNGGYSLARPPSEIRMGDIVRAAEGALTLVDCVGSPDLCSRSGDCMSRNVWADVSKNVESQLDDVTLQDVVNKEQSHGKLT